MDSDPYQGPVTPFGQQSSVPYYYPTTAEQQAVRQQILDVENIQYDSEASGDDEDELYGNLPEDFNDDDDGDQDGDDGVDMLATNGLTTEFDPVDDGDYSPADDSDGDDPVQDRSASSSYSDEVDDSYEPAKRGRGRGRPRGSSRGRAGRGLGSFHSSKRTQSSPSKSVRGRASAISKPRGSRGRGRARLRAAADGEPRYAYLRKKPPRREHQKGERRRFTRPMVNPGPEFTNNMRNATTLFMQGEYEDAAGLCRDAIRMNPEVFPPYSMLAEIHFKWGLPDQATQYLFTGAFTKPTEVEIWELVAKQIEENTRNSPSEEKAMEWLLNTYGQILKCDRTDLSARRRRQNIFTRLGQMKQATASCKALLKYHPHDLEGLRFYARQAASFHHEESAIDAYSSAFDHYRKAGDQEDEDCFTWVDVSLYAGLFISLKDFKSGILQLKSLSRWLCGRQDESFWDNHQENDCEWDDYHEPRRILVPDFDSSKHPVGKYGRAMTPAVRAKLGILRLKIGNSKEAAIHLEMFKPDGKKDNSTARPFSAPFREIADAIYDVGDYETAALWYGSLFTTEVQPSLKDAERYRNMADSYRRLGRISDSMNAYTKLISLQPGAWEHRLELIRLCEQRAQEGDEAIASAEIQALLRQNRHKELISSGLRSAAFVRERRHRHWRPIDLDAARRAGAIADSGMFDITEDGTVEQQLGNLPKIGSRRRDKQEELRLAEMTIEENYEGLRKLTQQLIDGSGGSIGKWLSTAIVLADMFLKHHALAERAVMQKPATTRTSKFAGLTYEEWVGIIGQTCLLLARYGEKDDAYEILARADRVPEFCFDDDFMQPRHLYEIFCAALALDEDRMYMAMRWHSLNYGHLNELCALYNLMGRIFPKKPVAYQGPHHQKFWARQVKAHDYALMTQAQRREARYSGAEKAFCSKYPDLIRPKGAGVSDPDGNPQKLVDHDAAVLCLYGNMLAMSGSFSNALNYYLRAYHEMPEDPLVLLSLASSYVQMSMRRTTENRHWDILTGMGFFQEYARIRKLEGDARPVLRAQREMEVDFNEGRMWHYLGLSHLALPAYERCLAVEKDANIPPEEGVVEEADYKREAAFALQEILLSGGDVEGARLLGEKWLVF